MATPSDQGAAGNGRLTVAAPTALGLATLGQIHAPDAQLRAAISKLAGAYRALDASNGSSSAAKLAVAAASKRINSLCPGAAS